MRLIIARHGETIDNTNKIIQGQTPGELSKNGLLQAKKLALRFMETKLDIIFSSDLRRALDTAYEVSKYQPFSQLIIEKELRERDFGELTGLTLEEFAKRNYPEPENGENKQQIYNRAKNILSKIHAQYFGKKVMLITHNGFYRALVSVLTKVDAKDLYTITPLSNTGVTEFILDHNLNATPLFINCTKHLD